MVAISLGDRVRILPEGVTEALGIAHKSGIVYAETTSSITGVEVIGTPSEDRAVCILLEPEDQLIWVAPHLLQLLDRAAGAVIDFPASRRVVREEHLGEDELKLD